MNDVVPWVLPLIVTIAMAGLAMLTFRRDSRTAMMGENRAELADKKSEIVDLKEQVIGLRGQVIELQGQLIEWKKENLALKDENFELRVRLQVNGLDDKRRETT